MYLKILTELVNCISLDIFLEYSNIVIAILSALLVPKANSMTNLVDDGSHEFTARTNRNLLLSCRSTDIRPASANNRVVVFKTTNAKQT